ncbi:MAG: histidinol-phosphatase [Alistipes sp.]|nr:histidinol-phosphatase [Alistipes sp.]
MKRFLILLALVGLCAFNAKAQKETKIPDVHSTLPEQQKRRTEIILPQVKGYNCYKADLHVHTIYSDGEITPRQRVREAWYDGLDILAITDHLEARNYEKYMLRALAPHNPDGKPHKYYHAGSVRLMKDGTDPGIRSDHNATFAEAVEFRDKEGYPLLLIKGSEISRKPQTQGHFNALFLKDVNAIYNIDAKETLRNVHKQGGIVIHNHPGYRRNTTDKSEWQAEVYAEKLFDGVEIANGTKFYPKMVRRCVEENLIMIGATDTHRPTSGMWKDLGCFRTMTIILAKECTEEAIKEAMLDRRTLVYSGGDMIGEEKWLAEFLNAAIETKYLGTTSKTGVKYAQYQLINTSSIAYKLRYKSTVHTLDPFKSIIVDMRVKGGDTPAPEFIVENMWHIDYQHPTVLLKEDK